MRTLSLTLVAVLFIALSSCKKDSQNQAFIGKWHEVKLDMYETQGTGTKLYYTTFLQPFTSLDYALFNSNGTVTLSQDYYYYMNGPGQTISTQAIPQQTYNWDYANTGGKLVLNTQPESLNPGGFSSADTLCIIHNDTLLWHTVGYPPVGNSESISDAYFVK